MSEKESVKFRGQSGHAAHDQPFSEVPDSGIPQVSKIRRAPESFSIVNVSVYGTPNRRHTFGRGNLLLRLVRMLFHHDNHVFFTGFGRRLQAIRLGSSQNLFQNVR